MRNRTRSPDEVEVLVRVVGNNEFVTPPFKVHASYVNNRISFYNHVWNVARRILDANFYQTSPGEEVIIHPYVTLVQETGTDNHSMLHMRWRTLNWDEPSAWPEYYRRCVLRGTAKTLLIEIHVGWTLKGQDSGWWLNLENELDAAGRGLARLEVKDLKRVVIEGNGYRIEKDWNVEREFPERTPVESKEEDCAVCKVVTEPNGLLPRCEGEWTGALITRQLKTEPVEPADIEMSG
ncbi:hypothetical protein H2200_006651 [Cladophialophora chaetospira]|uniref:Uncharacterized protein n=1 Tax=Cladophialophora chaetospira TaxID=386627 RepID=A0AA39CHW2_9EURO|nr:hypothetical protein H2200_006651 [Cladophialophora chaetospira]